MSEKMDGIRAYWDGNKLYSKQGKEILAPSQFTKDFPKIALDGELWLGRGNYEQLVNTIQSNEEEDWINIRYVIFDLPLSNEPYESRMNILKTILVPSQVNFIEIEQCNGQQHLEERLQFILDAGGEGLMVRKPHSFYEPGRSPSLLKIKVRMYVSIQTHDDQRLQDSEVKLVEVLPTGLLCKQYEN